MNDFSHTVTAEATENRCAIDLLTATVLINVILQSFIFTLFINAIIIIGLLKKMSDI